MIINIKHLFLVILTTLILLSITNNMYSTDFVSVSYAELNFLNKLTGKYQRIKINTGSIYKFDSNLTIVVRKCYTSPRQDEKENIAFLQIVKTSLRSQNNRNNISVSIPNDMQIKDTETTVHKLIFSGWLFSSSSSLNYLEDQVYDVTLINCS